MATPKSQRIGIWIIAIVMLVGTIGSFAVMVLANNNQQIDQARFQQLSDEFEEAKTQQASELSDKYFDTLNKFAKVPAKFNAKSVTKLATKDLITGKGGEIKEGDISYSIYYIGWNPDGKIFDQSFADDGKSLSAPLGGGQFIEGMNEGIVGMKIGGVRQITIPADLAYGEKGQGDDIPPNTPIKFIVLAIEVEEIEPSKELLDLYGQQQQQY